MQLLEVLGHGCLARGVLVEELLEVVDLLLERGEGFADLLQHQRVHLEALRVVWVPVAAEVCAAGCDLDHGDGGLDVLFERAGEAQLWADDAIDWGEIDPALGAVLVLSADAVGEEHVLLRLFHALEGGEALHVLRLRVGADHVGLASEEEDAQGLVVLLRLGGAGDPDEEGERDKCEASHGEVSFGCVRVVES